MNQCMMEGHGKMCRWKTEISDREGKWKGVMKLQDDGLKLIVLL
jgi:hypothetical protein